MIFVKMKRMISLAQCFVIYHSDAGNLIKILSDCLIFISLAVLQSA